MRAAAPRLARRAPSRRPRGPVCQSDRFELHPVIARPWPTTAAARYPEELNRHSGGRFGHRSIDASHLILDQVRSALIRPWSLARRPRPAFFRDSSALPGEGTTLAGRGGGGPRDNGGLSRAAVARRSDTTGLRGARGAYLLGTSRRSGVFAFLPFPAPRSSRVIRPRCAWKTEIYRRDSKAPRLGLLFFAG